jgi:hypothetical protein
MLASCISIFSSSECTDIYVDRTSLPIPWICLLCKNECKSCDNAHVQNFAKPGEGCTAPPHRNLHTTPTLGPSVSALIPSSLPLNPPPLRPSLTLLGKVPHWMKDLYVWSSAKLVINPSMPDLLCIYFLLEGSHVLFLAEKSKGLKGFMWGGGGELVCL